MKSLKRQESRRQRRARRWQLQLAAATPQKKVPAAQLTISPDREAELYEVYDHFGDQTAMYETLFNAAGAYFVFLSERLKGTGNATYSTYDNMLEELWYPLAEPQNHLDMQDKHAVTRLNPLKRTYHINYQSFKASTFSEDANPYLQFQRALQLWIPDFTLPTEYIVNSVGRIVPQWPKSLVSPVVPLEKFGAKIPELKATSTYDPNFVYYEGYTEHFRDMVGFRVRVDAQNSRFDDPYVDDSVTAGSLLGTNAHLSLDVYLEPYINWPKEYALWATGANTEKEFNPVNFLWIANKQVAAYASESGGNLPPPRLGSLNKVLTRNAARLSTLVRTVKPRSTEGFTILRSGRIAWVPEVNNVADYEAKQRALYDKAAKTVDLEAQSKQVGNLPVYSDWLNNIFTYTDGTGGLASVDLNGAIPLDEVTLHRSMNAPFSVAAGVYLDHYRVKIEDLLNPRWISGVLGTPNYPMIFENFDKLFAYLGVAAPEATFVQILEGDLDGLESDQSSAQERYKQACRLIRAVLTQVDSERSQYALGTRIRSLEFLHYMLSKLGQFKALTERVRAKRETNSPSGGWFAADNKGASIDLYNLPGITHLLPHQADLYREQRQAPEAWIGDVDPGGGKTLIISLDIVTLLAAKKIKRPLVLVPGGLVKEFVTELNRYSKGQINVFPIRAKTIQKLQKIGWDRARIVKYMRSLPPNTVFITDLTYITSKYDIDTRELQEPFAYGTLTVDTFPIIDFLLDLECDALYIDESHKVKNLDATRTAMAANLAAASSFKRVSTGTLISDVAGDLVGQTSMINPNILGSKETFSENIYIDGDSRKGLVPGAAAIIDRQLRPYAARFTKKRREWAFLLPAKTNELFWSVDLTPKQQKFYNAFMEDTIAEIMRDAKLLKLMASGDEANSKKIENELKRYFAKVEIFLNAPSANAAFVETVDDPKDLIAPKLTLVDQIISYHLKGGTLQRGEKDSVVFKASKDKIIVFGYNKAVSRHFYDNTIHKDIAVHYTAGDENAVARFKSDPKVTVMFADEESLKEGFNFQMASRMIRLQTLWSPGGQNQSFSRVMRPDVANKYNRQEINYDWILYNGTLEIAKTARLISKTIYKAILDEANTPSWTPVEEKIRGYNIPMLSMNLDAIKDYNNFGSLSDYFSSYTLLKRWEDEEFARSTESLRKRVAKVTGKVPESREELIRGALVPAANRGLIDGSKQVYVPWVEGGIPYDPQGFGLQPVSLVETLDEDEEGAETQAFDVAVGQKVLTEFGPGEIVGLTKLSLKVQVYGFGTITLAKSLVMVPTDSPDNPGVKKFDAYLKKLGKFGAPTIKKNGVAVVNAPPNAAQTPLNPPSGMESEDVMSEQPAPKLQPTPTETKRLVDRPGEVEIFTSTVNNMVAVWSLYNDQDAGVLLEHGFRQHPAFVNAQIRNHSGSVALLKLLQKKFDLPPDSVKALQYLATTMKGGQGKLYQVSNIDFGAIKNYWLINSQKNKYPSTLKIWPMVWDRELYVCATVHIQPKVVQKLLTMPKIPGVEKFKVEDNFILKLYKTPAMAMKDLERINKKVRVARFEEEMESLGKLKFVKKPT